MDTIYQTTDGRQFENQTLAQSHANDLAREAAEREVYVNEMRSFIKGNVEAFYKPFEEVKELLHQGDVCCGREDWNGAINALKEGVARLTSPEWKNIENVFLSELSKTLVTGKDIGAERKEKNQKFVDSWRNGIPEWQALLAASYQNCGYEAQKRKDYEAAINDHKSALAVHPFNDQFREDTINNLGLIYALRGVNYFKSEDMDRAIADFSVAIKLNPETKSNLVESFSQAHVARCNDYFAKSKEAITNGDNDNFEKLSKQVYLDASSVIVLTPNGEYADFAKQVMEMVSSTFPKFANLPPQEDPAVKKLMNELSKNPSASSKKVTTVSNAAQERTQAFSQRNASANTFAPSSTSKVKVNTEGMSAGAITEKGLEFYNAKDNDTAFAYWIISAEMGHYNAQSNIGNCYRNGWGTPKDDVKAVYWWRKGAEQGNKIACFNMGFTYEEGIGNTPIDKATAIYWYEKALSLGNEDAKIKLAKLKKAGSASSNDNAEAQKKSKKYNIIGAVAGGVILSLIINFPIGTIIGAIAGWFLGNKIGRKFLLIVFIVGAIGGGLYFGRAYIEPVAASLIAAVTGKSNPLAQTVMVTADALNLRAEASGNSQVVKALKKATR